MQSYLNACFRETDAELLGFRLNHSGQFSQGRLNSYAIAPVSSAMTVPDSQTGHCSSTSSSMVLTAFDRHSGHAFSSLSKSRSTWVSQWIQKQHVLNPVRRSISSWDASSPITS